MKRVKLYLILVLTVLLVAAAVYWRRSSDASVVLNGKNSDAQTQTDVGQFKPSSNVAATISEASKPPVDRLAQMGITPDMPQAEREKKFEEWYIREAHKLVPEQRPFAFYGKVVDENTQAVAGASVRFGLRTTTAAEGTSEVNTISTADGNFSLIEGTGSHVHIDVWKNGYYTVTSMNQDEFNPAEGSSYQPILFHLRKKGVGADLVTSKYGVSPDFRVAIPLDNTSPVRVNLLARYAGQDGQLILTQIKPAYEKWKQATAWSFKMEIPDGGFVEESGEFPFEAPESGYQPVVAFDFQQQQSVWATDVRKDYYIKFGNPPCYGHLHVDTAIHMTGARLTYAINPSGSRNLEPK